MAFYESHLPLLACFLLFFSTLGYWSSLFAPENTFFLKASSFSVAGSNYVLAYTLLSRWTKEGYFPLSNLYESLLFLCWGISFFHLAIEYQAKSRLIGVVLAPIEFVICTFLTLTLPIEMQKALPLVPSLQSNWLMMHVSMMMLSYATLFSGSLLSLFYLALDFFSSKKKRKKIINTKAYREEITWVPAGFRKPAELAMQRAETTLAVQKEEPKIIFSKKALLETLDIWSYRIITLGFPFLTIGIISGAVWANEAWGSYWSWDPKETWALIAWLVFASYLHVRLLKGWQGRNAAIVGSGGFFILWICYLGVNFLSEGLHTYGWLN